MQHKIWAKIFILAISSFLLLNFFIWKAYTEDILTFSPYYNGGLDRMGYIAGSKHYRKPESTLPKGFIENIDYKGDHVDIITIGDSFSNMAENGSDPLYQSWLASLYQLDVLNLQPLKNMDELETAITLLNSGYLDKIKPRFLLIESVERYAVIKFSKDINFSLNKPISEIEEYYRYAKYKRNYPDVEFTNIGNFKFIVYNLLYLLSDNAFFSKVYVRDLDRSFFSVKNDRKLLFYYEDLKYIPYSRPAVISKLNNNLNEFSKKLKSKGIELIFMVAADKYTMYSDYIINNPYPQSTFFELLRDFPKDYYFVDTKAILSGLIKLGEKDVYYADDTHWSWKASKKIAESMAPLFKKL